MRRSETERIPATLWVALGAIVAGLLALNELPLVAEARQETRVRTAPAEAFGSGATARALRELGRIHPVPFSDTGRTAARPSAGARRVEAYGLDALPLSEMPSTTAIPAAERSRTDIDILSLSLHNQAATTLLDSPEERGLDWERPGYLTLMRGGDIRFAGGVGARIHGGQSRIGSANKSFRLYFRDDYGAPGLAASAAFDEGPGAPLREVIAHNDLREDLWGQPWHFVNSIAYSIAERLGCLVPRTRPVQFYLNGDRQGVFFLTERLGVDYLAARFGHDRFTVARTRRDVGSGWFEAGDRSTYDSFLARYVGRPELPRTTTSRLAREVDVDNLTNWFVSVIFSATNDWYQGIIAREQSEEGRWFWVNWDLDHSYVGSRLNRLRPWNRDMFQEVLNKPTRPRSVFLTSLIANDPAYRQELATRLVGALNHELTPSYLGELLSRHRGLAELHGLEDTRFLDDIEAFFAARSEVVLRQAAEPLGFGPPTTITVTMGDGGRFEIDGYDAVDSAELRYLRRMALEIRVPRAAARRLVNWRINGEIYPADGARLTTTAERNVHIEAVFADDEGIDP